MLLYFLLFFCRPIESKSESGLFFKCLEKTSSRSQVRRTKSETCWLADPINCRWKTASNRQRRQRRISRKSNQKHFRIQFSAFQGRLPGAHSVLWNDQQHFWGRFVRFRLRQVDRGRQRGRSRRRNVSDIWRRKLVLWTSRWGPFSQETSTSTWGDFTLSWFEHYYLTNSVYRRLQIASLKKQFSFIE